MPTNSEVRSYAERLVKLMEQAKEISADMSNVRIQAKLAGYDDAALLKVAKLMFVDQEKRTKMLDQLDMFTNYLSEAGVR